MTISYTPTELQLRSKIFATHSLLIDFLTMDVMNNFVHLFDQNCCNGHHYSHKTIASFIEEERKERGLDPTNVIITSKADKESNANSRLLVEINKNGKAFVHLTIHLVSMKRDPEKYGMIHIKKDIYLVKRSCRNKDEYCALLKVEAPNDRSLRFSIAFDDNTSTSPLAVTYDEEVNKEMDVIVAVLNNMFDADNDDYFVGNPNMLVGNSEMRLSLPIQNKTNVLLSNMNAHPQIATRKNRGRLMNIAKSHHPANAYFHTKSNRIARRIVQIETHVNHIKIDDQVHANWFVKYHIIQILYITT